MIDFSPKQKIVWQNTVKSFHRWNISYGATRSGKTYIDYFKIPYRIRSASKDGLIVLIGNTAGTIERNILDPLRGIWSDALVGYPSNSGKIRLFGRDCYCLGAEKSSQVSKLQGSGIVYCYGDEITTWSRDVFEMLKSRLDKKGACFDGTCNPDNPNHWVNKFLNSKADIFQMQFTIDDNPFLDPVFVSSLKKEYSGTVYYDRYISGLWRAAEGIIYRIFADNPSDFIINQPPPDITFCTAGLDFGGNRSAHALNLTGFTKGLKQIVTLDEWYSPQPLDPLMLEKAVCDFLERNLKLYRITDLYCDSAEQVLIRGIKTAAASRKIPVNIHNAKKGHVNERIRFYSRLFGLKKYFILSHCVNTINAFSEAVWEDSVCTDKRLDNGSCNIDSLDAQEYSTEFIMNSVIV